MSLLSNSPKLYLFRSDLLRLGSKVFAYPDADTLHDIRTMVRELSRDDSFGVTVYNALNRSPRLLEDTDIQTVYSDLFIKGAVPITESHCCARFNAVPDVSAFYNAFGVEPRSGESPDSLMHELEFAGYLALKIACAPDDERRSLTEDAYRTFLAEHCADFLEAFSTKLRQTHAPQYYQMWSVTLYEFVREELERLAVTGVHQQSSVGLHPVL